MKALLCFCLFYSSYAFGIERDIFNDKFPTAEIYQTTIFSELKDYFEVLATKSILFVDIGGVHTYRLSNGVEIRARIFREVLPNGIHESVIYSLNNGRNFNYEVVKIGSQVKPTEDLDLLQMKFRSVSQDESYTIKVPAFGFELISEKSALKDSSYILIDTMGFNLKIEALFSQKSAVLQYHYFYKGSSYPQNSLFVKAEDLNLNWGEVVNLSYSSSTAGLITPQMFFEGLAGASSFYSETARVFSMIFMNLGFPKLE